MSRRSSPSYQHIQEKMKQTLAVRFPHISTRYFVIFQHHLVRFSDSHDVQAVWLVVCREAKVGTTTKEPYRVKLLMDFGLLAILFFLVNQHWQLLWEGQEQHVLYIATIVFSNLQHQICSQLKISQIKIQSKYKIKLYT